MDRPAPFWTVLGTAGLSVGLHLFAGWAWTPLAGVVAAVVTPRRGWLWGGAGVALGWLTLILYTAVAAPGGFSALLEVVGDFARNIPGEAMVGLSVLLGASLGAIGGAAGMLLGPAIWKTGGPRASS